MEQVNKKYIFMVGSNYVKKLGCDSISLSKSKYDAIKIRERAESILEFANDITKLGFDYKIIEIKEVTTTTDEEVSITFFGNTPRISRKVDANNE